MRFPVLCRACARLDEPGFCMSFPEGIPDDIWTFGRDHRVSISGEPPFELDPARRADYDLWLRTFGAAGEWET